MGCVFVQSGDDLTVDVRTGTKSSHANEKLDYDNGSQTSQLNLLPKEFRLINISTTIRLSRELHCVSKKFPPLNSL